ncbi:hypothetical protein MKZ08_07275 [Viridibacillus sp. FSL R5-0477]|uniref:Uncharacterized protein n=1 Tax=Viridibacillus arenosi FSL R5-213 TaxID=1227360 RepID=W4EYN4_9BACL|nr:MULTISPECIES: hypothetical protein [Viridibacillus]ETT85334.1 hypothetical protein C176_11574 [Viridibacillus arenosi FSL R5-213]OMC80948.1 hypothetical protein BK130_16635 [Viridibacillus sp. FSL H8-0123]OMC86618.1 hypothetical protein BK128_11200 [Viridibacillus sp. FSL H7-0596]OMC89394.1 hypothetical protein BK137_18285 [Viridibacillus arenosi]
MLRVVLVRGYSFIFILTHLNFIVFGFIATLRWNWCGTDVVTVANQLGESSEMVLKVYTHASDENKNVSLEVFKDALQI